MNRILGAFVKAFFVAIVIAAPSFLVSDANQSTREISLIIGGLVGVFVLFEYAAPQPGLIDFRFAPPYNRARFAVFTVVLLLVTFYARALANAGADPFSGDLIAFADRLVAMSSFNFSPVALAADTLAPGGSPELQGAIRGAAALAMFASGAGALLFIVVLWLFRWPTARMNFHLWANLPTFNPKSRTPVEKRLARMGFLNIVVGIALPFVLLAAASRAGDFVDEAVFRRSLPLIWAATLWATSSALLILRGAAMLKVARLVAKSR